MRAILFVVSFLVSAPALASDKVDFKVKPSSSQKASESTEAETATGIRTPLRLPIETSRIKEIQEARDKRTGVKTEFSVSNLRDHIVRLETVIVGRPDTRLFRAKPKPFFKYDQCVDSKLK